MRKKNMLILLVLLLTVGFASISTTIMMNGSIGIASKKSDLNVIFKSATVNGNSAAKATISEDKKTITFETDKLSTVGDSVELIYKVKNDSTQYDANVKVSCTGGNPGYINVVSEFAGKSLALETSELMGAQEVRMGKISVNLIKAYDESVTKTPLTCTLEIEGEERDSIVDNSTCAYPDGTEWTFDYTGSEQEFVVPCAGKYKLETWGAQGGDSIYSYNGGYGAYAVGNINIYSNSNVYINVGGKGESSKSSQAALITKGGYNGGGNGVNHSTASGRYVSAGGGATHIATKSGLLSSLSEDVSSIYIVSSGGSGTGYYSSDYYAIIPGHGGGISGTSGQTKYGSDVITMKIPNQTSGYSFGQGASGSDEGAGGGGGFYGGFSSGSLNGSGGSSYIGNPFLTNKAMYCYNCATSNDVSTKTISTTNVSSTPISNYAKSGNGYAKITLVSAINPYKEALLNGTDPVIKENLIPVTIENDGTVRKADIETEWYKYEDKRWANAIILSDETINYNAGEKIPESNIESYFVWIPKYKYKLWDLGNYNSLVDGKPTSSKAKEIEIVFGTGNTEDVEGISCKTPMISGTTGECNVGEYMTHPAFISMETNGLWIGKFETTGTTSNITVKPGVTSLRSLSVKTIFDTSYNYQRNHDSHMMKNTEWGSVAYLSHSKYGINEEVNINNNSNYLTGYSAVIGTDQSSFPGTYGTDSSKTLPYNTEAGYLASTTGNITGIYDTSGGAHEYMASYISGKIGSSGFSDITNGKYAKYIDVYSSSSTATTYQYRILGDATGEMGPFFNYADRDGSIRAHNSWYADRSQFIDSDRPWFHRSGLYDYGSLASLLSFNKDTGGSYAYLGFRIVLAYNKEITPPVIVGGGDSWTADNQTISLETPGTAVSGVKNYEYYISPTIKDPGENVTGTTTGDVLVSKEGINYIYYRTVSNSGKKSSWSNYVVTKIDKTIPTITMVEAGTYEMSDDRELATSTFGEGGGETTCTNVSYGGSFTKMSGIKAFGNQTIKCTAAGNNGKSVSKTVTYTIYAFYNGANMICSYYGSGSCTKNGTSVTIPPRYVQYGPYRKAAKGCYKVTYEGSGFVTNALYKAYQNDPKIEYTLLSKSITSTKVTYYFNITSDLTGSGLEVVIINNTSGSITIKSAKVEPVSTCPTS